MTSVPPEPFERFLVAQAPVLYAVHSELKAGRKRTHWMWFVFPQLAGLGHSEMSSRYALQTRAEAAAYLRHMVLGERLVAMTRLVNALENRAARDIFGQPDDLKFHSSMTLFAAAGGGRPFVDALDKFFGGASDPATLRLLTAAEPARAP